MNNQDEVKTNLEDVEGWTPLVDELVQRYGVVGAAVFGRIWRYCQMKDRVCRVPLSRIGEALSLEKSTISRYVARLVEDGYLRDLTPDAGNRPHIYEETGKISVDLSSKPKEAKSVAQKNVAQKNATSPSKSVAQENAHPVSASSSSESVVLSNASGPDNGKSVAQKNVAQKNVVLSNESVAQENAGVALKNAHIRKEETIKRQEERNGRVRARSPSSEVKSQERSRYSREECVEYAKSQKGIKNPGGYGKTIWLSGEDDEEIEKFLANPPPWAQHYERVLKEWLREWELEEPARKVIAEVLEELPRIRRYEEFRPLNERLQEVEINLT